MSKKNRKPQAAEVASPKTETGKEEKTSQPIISFYGFRELIESVAIAFILAFLFRTFEAEAFVIPTGSMATTLMGRHKDFVCEKCGYPFQVSASEEIDADSGQLTNAIVKGGVCPMCRYSMDLNARALKEKDNRSFNGDRIIVGKFMYELVEPARWDVSVFKYPAQAKTNFIKRLVGLPKETVRISHGDIFVKPDGSEDFVIARKPPNKLQAMLQTVYDNDYVLPGMLEKGWPARWQGEGNSGGWMPSGDHRSFTVEGGKEGTAWLQYRHIIPQSADWHALAGGPLPVGYKVKPQLITDFVSYNAGIVSGTRQDNPLRGCGLHWVGDLAVESTIDVQNDSGEILFKLVEGGRDMLCTINLATGKAVLSISGESFSPSGQTPIVKPGKYTVMFANADDQLRLWVDGKVIEFDRPTTYDDLHNRRPQIADLTPAAIGSRGVKMKADRLKVFRDIYYIANKTGGNPGVADYELPYKVFHGSTPRDVAEFFSDPSRWDTLDSDNMRSVEFPLAADQFLMLGDNSAMSRDSRLWNPNEYYVARDLMIGKALYIYWPHSWDKLPGTDMPFPFFPNFQKMKLVR